MSDDIVERLRARAYRLATKDFNGDGAKLAVEAEDEITRLRADLASVTAERDYVMTEGLFSADQIRILKTERDAAIAERDRMREALKPFASPPLYVFDRPLKYVPAPMTEDWIGGGWFSTEDFCRARAALEGVKEPAKGADLGQ